MLSIIAQALCAMPMLLDEVAYTISSSYDTYQQDDDPLDGVAIILTPVYEEAHPAPHPVAQVSHEPAMPLEACVCAALLFCNAILLGCLLSHCCRKNASHAHAVHVHGTPVLHTSTEVADSKMLA